MVKWDQYLDRCVYNLKLSHCILLHQDTCQCLSSLKLKRKNLRLSLLSMYQQTEIAEWTSQQSSDDIQICIDPRPLNKVLKHEQYQLSNIDKVQPRLTNFSQYQWLRIPFGTCVSYEIFHNCPHLALNSLNGIACVVNEIIMFDSGDKLEQTSADQDLNLKFLLQCCCEIIIKLNKEKFSWRNQLNGKDPAEIDAVTKLQPPTSMERVHWLCGTVY